MVGGLVQVVVGRCVSLPEHFCPSCDHVFEYRIMLGHCTKTAAIMGARTSSARSTGTKRKSCFFFVTLVAGGLQANRNDLKASRSTEILVKREEISWPIIRGPEQTVAIESYVQATAIVRDVGPGIWSSSCRGVLPKQCRVQQMSQNHNLCLLAYEHSSLGTHTRTFARSAHTHTAHRATSGGYRL